MKKLSALVATLVLGVSSAAIAAPSYGAPRPAPQPAYKPAPAPLVIRDHRDHRIVRPMPAPVWKQLAASQLGRTQTIAVNRAAWYSTLKLEATRGTTYVDRVVITFANGRTQTVSVRKNLGVHGPAAVIDLAGDKRQIAKIQILGKGGFRSGYKLLAV